MANWKGLLGGLLARILNAKPTADDPPPPALPAPLPIPHGPSDAELRSKPEGYASDAPAGAPSIPCRHCGQPRSKHIGVATGPNGVGPVVFYCHAGEPGTPFTTWDPAV